MRSFIRRLSIVGLLLFVSVNVTPNPTPTSYAATGFNVDTFLIARGITSADSIVQAVNPDNGVAYDTWSIRTHDGRALDTNDLPKGITFSPTGTGVYLLSTIPFDGEMFLVAHGARTDLGDVIVQITNPDDGTVYPTWSYKGRTLEITPAHLPKGVVWIQVAEDNWILAN